MLVTPQSIEENRPAKTSHFELARQFHHSVSVGSVFCISGETEQPVRKETIGSLELSDHLQEGSKLAALPI